MSGWRLLGDIGGTNARFAQSRRPGEVVARRNYRIAEFPDFEAAVGAYLDDAGDRTDCSSAAIGAAGPVVGRRVKLTNAPWQVSEAALSQILGDCPVCLLNDMQAVALALPRLSAVDVMPVGGISGPPEQRRRMLVLNVGTGFGAAMADWVAEKWVTRPSEAGHMSFAARSDDELSLLGAAAASAVTVEDVLSGAGLASLYRELGGSPGPGETRVSSEQVFARVASDEAASKAVELFTKWLGRVAKDLTLAMAAWDGVYLAGGVIRGWCKVASSDLFRKHFETQGKMQARLRSTFTAAITRNDVSLLGLSHLELD